MARNKPARSTPVVVRSRFRRFVELPYLGVPLLAVLLIPLYAIVPGHYYTDDSNLRALFLAFACGSLVGITEISSRYRDEQIKAILSPDGLAYFIVNGALSTFALFFVFYAIHHQFSEFASLKNNPLEAALLAGFGATAVMRTRLAVVKGSDNKDISIGPDIVIGLLLTLIDRRIDRWRAAKRQDIIATSFPELKALGSVDEASQYLLASLLSFQNLSDAEKKQFTDTIASNKQLGDENIQLAAVGFLFLTVVGEENFQSVLEKAKRIQSARLPSTGQGTAGVSVPPIPGSPAQTSVPPPPILPAPPPITVTPPATNPNQPPDSSTPAGNE